MTKQEMIDAIYADMGICHEIYQWPDSAPAVEFEPVRIGDVIEYIRLKNIWDINPITDEWDYPRLPIDEQSDDAISFVYNLIKK